MFHFGAGNLFGVDNSSAVPTPVKFGTLQEVNIEFSFSEKELSGQYQFPVAIGRGKSKITGKAKLGKIQTDVFASLFFGLAKTVGQKLVAIDEVGAIPNDPGPYTVTVANSATFETDMGVYFADTGKPLTKVADSPAAGQYSEAAGVYTFAAADKQKSVKFCYIYTSATGGQIINITNQLMGLSPTFKAVLAGIYEGKTVTLILNSCSSSKLSLPTKNEDWTISEFDFGAKADAANNIGFLSVAD